MWLILQPKVSFPQNSAAGIVSLLMVITGIAGVTNLRISAFGNVIVYHSRVEATRIT